MSVTKSISRRTLLRGLGVSLALPVLDSVMPARALAAASASSSVPPLRMAFMFVPNGVFVPDWTPQTAGFGFDLPYILEPLASVRDDVCVLTGLTHDKGRANDDGAGDHARSASVFLTGAQPRKTSGANIRSGISVDQFAAQRVGNATRFPSLELGIEAGRSAGSCDSGYSCAYSSNIAWSSESTPVAKETNPRAVFERLFAGGSQKEIDASQNRRKELHKSILDFVLDDAQRLRNRLGGNDTRKLDEYLNGVREIERRIEMAEEETSEALPTAVLGYERPAGKPREFEQHARLMCDMMTLAFQTDSTRISTFMLANAGSNHSYRNIGISSGHHELSHHRGDRVKTDQIRKINRFHVQQLVYFLEKLKAIPEADGCLLDNCMIVYGSGISDGNRHNNENLPVILAGRGGGTIDTGRHIRYDQETPMNNLYMSLLDRMGAPAEFIGDSTGQLGGLTV